MNEDRIRRAKITARRKNNNNSSGSMDPPKQKKPAMNKFLRHQWRRGFNPVRKILGQRYKKHSGYPNNDKTWDVSSGSLEGSQGKAMYLSGRQRDEMACKGPLKRDLFLSDRQSASSERMTSTLSIGMTWQRLH
jgi:hypothetical protein